MLWINLNSYPSMIPSHLLSQVDFILFSALHEMSSLTINLFAFFFEDPSVIVSVSGVWYGGVIGW